MTGPQPGPDGRPRCPWALGADDLLAYHDEEWGRPVHDEDALFERLVLEGFQSGLSWATILRKREAFRAAFDGFRVDAVAAFGEQDVERLLQDAGIVRHRGKIEAAVANARATAALHAEGLTLRGLLEAHGPAEPPPAPHVLADVPAQTEGSKRLSKELKRRGFRFVGPTTLYAAMQACGVVDDHLRGCIARRSPQR